MKIKIRSWFCAIALFDGLHCLCADNVLYSYCDGWDIGDLTNGVRVHFSANVPIGFNVSIPVSFDGQRVCFRLQATNGFDAYARQLDCGHMQLNPYGPIGPSLVTFGPYDSSGTIAESGSVVIDYAGSPSCPHGYGAVTLFGDVYIGFDPSDPPPDENETKESDETTSCAAEHGMAAYSIHLMLASLHIEDTPISYRSARGPSVECKISYNQQEANQPQVFAYSNFGPKWTFNWLSYVVDDPTNPAADASVYDRGGGTEVFTNFNSSSESYAADKQTLAVLVRTSSTTYEKRFHDGSKEVFSICDESTSYPRRIFLTSVADAAGNAVSLTYDSSFRITRITDATGQATTFCYNLQADPLKITQITDPFGRLATFAYANGELIEISDPFGIQSQFSYQPGTTFISTMTTPYGTTKFSTGQAGSSVRWLQVTDPAGGQERVEYNNSAGGISSAEAIAPSDVENSSLNSANTFYWDKKAMTDAPGDYTKARVIHWLKSSDRSKISGIKHSEKRPLENRVWYSYGGQPDGGRVGATALPTRIARILDDGSTQALQLAYNAWGNVTQLIDPVGRVTSYVYDANNIDLLTVYQRNAAGVSRDPSGAAADTIAAYTYNSLHEPLTATDAAGQRTTYTYRSDGHGQLQSVQNAKGETTSYSYGPAIGVPTDYLASIKSPPFNGASAVTSFTYDAANRIRMVTDSDGYTVTTDYDDLDRPIQIIYPDATNQQFQYSQDFGQGLTAILDLTKSKDRRGLWTIRHYNANRQLDSITDPQNRTTLFGWCTCGALASITDPNQHTTTFTRDLQSRLIGKVFADNTSVSNVYENTTSRLKSMTDALNQTTNYQYLSDDNLKQVSYTNAAHPTPTVTFTYDPSYNRVKTMIDGIGTTNYGYNPIASPPALGAGQLVSIDSPIANDTITFGYDQLGRVTTRSINGTANSATWVYDSLGRVSSAVNKLGTFTNTYVGVTNRLSKITYPGAMTVNYSYFPNAQNKRLQEIKNVNSKSAMISQFDYTYDVEGEITTWQKNYTGLSAPQRFDLGYDNAGQLLTAPLKKASTNALIKQYTYGYDLGANRTSELVGTVTTTSTPNSVNEITSQSGGAVRTLTYDLNGSVTNDGKTRTFEWDGANRLTAVNYIGTTKGSEFTYDGLSRLAKIVEKSGTKITSTRKIVWCGNEQCECRDASDAVTLRIYAQGQYAGTTPYYYTRDHLGSIREMVKSGGTTLAARYDYDPYGRSTTITGSTLPDFNFTGLYRHSPSNLDFATYRAYDPDLGRWLNRDPIGEAGGSNLYNYASNDSVNRSDPLGLLTVLVHGTKLRNSSDPYFAPQFIRAVGRTFRENPVLWEWSGADDNLSRQIAGLGLAVYLMNYKRDHPCEPVNVIAHSHGGNVAFIASEMVEIDTLVTLGTPIREYSPNLNNINELINVFSVRDGVQSLLGGADHSIFGNEFGRAFQTLPYGGPVENREVLTTKSGTAAHSELLTRDVWNQLFH